LATLLVSIPNGFAVDRWGRKRTLIPGLALLAFAAYLFSTGTNYAPVILIVLVYGAAEGMCVGAAQAYAMDLAPVERRGSFLGVWTFWQSLGGTVAPLVVAFAADHLGFASTFTAVAAYLLFVCGLMWSIGPDTRRRTRAAERPAAILETPRAP
jgi:MFS family permease